MGERRPLYGQPAPQFAAVTAGIWVESHEQARLLQRALELAMRELAGRPEETFLAKCFNDLESYRARAIRENWKGWDDSAGRAALSRVEGR